MSGVGELGPDAIGFGSNRGGGGGKGKGGGTGKGGGKGKGYSKGGRGGGGQGAGESLARGDGAAIYAARSGDLDGVKAAIASDAEAVHATDHLGRTALHLAAWGGQVSIIEALLEAGALVSTSAQDHTLAIHFAAQNGHTECCKALLKIKGQIQGHVNARGTKRADTPLHLAAFKGHKETVEYLLKKNADCGIRNKLGKLPLDVCSDGTVRSILATAVPGPKGQKQASAAGPSVVSAADDEDRAAEDGEEEE
jgi:hypothetical protein